MLILYLFELISSIGLLFLILLTKSNFYNNTNVLCTL